MNSTFESGRIPSLLRIRISDMRFPQAIIPILASLSVLTASPAVPAQIHYEQTGAVLAWGAGTTYDDSGKSANYGQSLVPLAAQSDVIAIAAGVYHTLALKSDGSVIAWGLNDEGQTNVPETAKSGVIAIAAGGGEAATQLP
jgi:hypothetical protein